MAPVPLAGPRCRAQRKPLRLRAMTLTELYYYYGNHPSPKVGSLPAFSLSPTTEGCALPELAADELIDGLEDALRRVTALHAHASPPLVDLARRSLAALTR